ncbi:hypothetical protein BDR04DRAFT_1161345 [Suillus decipiens]|nr:hypothetical protein BDR04DRAFT_1161345 [Suillus decipiens]
MTLKGHGDRIQFISYFPDGQRMISGCLDKTTRKWGLKTGKAIQAVRNICEKDVCEEAVSRNGRWVVTGDGDNLSDEDDGEDVGELKAFDISADSTLLASGSYDKIWNLETGKLVAGPFKSTDWSTSHGSTINLWAFESHASFDVQIPFCLTLSPHSRQLVYTSYTEDES